MGSAQLLNNARPDRVCVAYGPRCLAIPWSAGSAWRSSVRTARIPHARNWAILLELICSRHRATVLIDLDLW